MNVTEARAIREAVTDIEQGHALLALALLRGVLPPADPLTVPSMPPIVRHRAATACAGSELDADGRCHTCGAKVV